VSRWLEVVEEVGEAGHPPWCEQGHHCTYPMRPHGHASVPEVFVTRVGRVVATRHGSDRRGHLEVRIVLPLPELPEEEVETFMRAAVAVTVATLDTELRSVRRRLWLRMQRAAYFARARG